MARFSPAVLASFLWIASSTTNGANSPSASSTAQQRVRRRNRELTLNNNNVPSFDGDSSGSSSGVHECDMTVSIPFNTPKTIKVKPTDKVKQVEESIEKAYGVDVPSIQRFVVGHNSECEPDAKLIECGICATKEEAIGVKVEFSGTSMTDYVLKVVTDQAVVSGADIPPKLLVKGNTPAHRRRLSFPVFEEEGDGYPEFEDEEEEGFSDFEDFEEDGPPDFFEEEEPPEFADEGPDEECSLPAEIEFGKYEGNPQCVSDFGFQYGWKMEGCVDGVYTLERNPDDPTEVTGDCPEAAYVEVVVTCKEDKAVTLSWNAHKEAKVVVKIKGGSGGELFDTTGTDSGTFFAPMNAGGEVADISHIEFCLVCDGCGDDNPDDEFEGPPELEPGFCYRDMHSDDPWQDHKTYVRKPPYDEKDGNDYRGKVHESAEGKECQRWDSQTPHKHTWTPESYPDKGLVDNYCRNPDGKKNGPWCYTTDEDIEWRYCELGIRPVEKLAHGSETEVDGVKGRIDDNCEFLPKPEEPKEPFCKAPGPTSMYEERRRLSFPVFEEGEGDEDGFPVFEDEEEEEEGFSDFEDEEGFSDFEDEGPPDFEDEPPEFADEGPDEECSLPAEIEFGKYEGNPQCVSDFGFQYGWKMEGCVDGVYTLERNPDDPVEVTGDCPEAAYVEVVVTCNAEDKSVTLSWNAHKEAKVVVKIKGGSGGELFDTTGTDKGKFFAPTTGGGTAADISHIEFCLQCDGCGDSNPDDEFEGPPDLEPGFCYRDMHSDDPWQDHKTYVRKPPYDEKDGNDYRGKVHESAEGKECQRWDSQTPHKHTWTPESYPDKGLESNYCRNPDGKKNGPWCYTTDEDIEWRYCELGIRPVEKLAHGSETEVDGVKGRIDDKCEFVTNKSGGDCEGKIKVKFKGKTRIFKCIETGTKIGYIKEVLQEWSKVEYRNIRLSYNGSLLSKEDATLSDYGYDICNPKGVIVIEDMDYVCHTFFGEGE